ncbi:class I SAM-dependent methyltransferase [Candidatus Latescibacterota bacterium]
MSDRTEQSIADSLETDKKLLPHMPFLLQDLWALGSSVEYILDLIGVSGFSPENTHILDLGCGKGAVSVQAASRFGFQVTGVDFMESFLEEARKKSREYDVSHLCSFKKKDIIEYVSCEHEFDVVILASLGGILGTLSETVACLRTQVRSGGFMLVDDGYLRNANSMKRKGYEHCRNHSDSIKELTSFDDIIIKEMNTTDYSSKINYEYLYLIEKRAQELIERYPDLKDDIQTYIKLQAEECDVINDHFEGALWLIQKADK